MGGGGGGLDTPPPPLPRRITGVWLYNSNVFYKVNNKRIVRFKHAYIFTGVWRCHADK